MLTTDTREAALARDFSQLLARYRDGRKSLFVRVLDAEQEKTLELPGAVVCLLIDGLEALAAGRAVSVVLDNEELTTVQAAAMLNVSRPYFIKLLTEGAIPYRRVGTHRRILREDVVNYKSRIDREREAVLDELAAQAQDQDMGYVRS